MNEIDKADHLIKIGYITRPHGIRGEVKVNYLLEDGAEKIRTLKSVYVRLNSGKNRILDIQNIRFQNSNLILKLKDSISRNDAEFFRGCEILVPKELLSQLSKDEYHPDEIIGLKVKNISGEFLGNIINVLKLPMQEVYVLENDGIESLIPAVDEFVKKIDVEKNEIIIDPIDGMINQNEN